jgi:hypothetical protein
MILGSDVDRDFRPPIRIPAMCSGSGLQTRLARGPDIGGFIHCFTAPSGYPRNKFLEPTPKHTLFQPCEQGSTALDFPVVS